jgi:cytochrome c oxidase subunit II
VTPTKTGRYPLPCTELCGLGHAVMRTKSLVLEENEFEKWARDQRASSAAGGGG